MLNNRKKKGYLKVMNSCVVVGKILKPVGWKEGVYEILLECNRPYLMEDGNFNTDVFSMQNGRKGRRISFKNHCGENYVFNN